MIPVIVVRTAKLVRSGLRNVNTSAATASSAEPAKANTDCTLSWALGLAPAGAELPAAEPRAAEQPAGAKASAAATATGTRSAVATETPSATATGAATGLPAGHTVGTRSSRRSRARIAFTTRPVAFLSSPPSGPL
jgi:hypothetical protein